MKLKVKINGQIASWPFFYIVGWPGVDPIKIAENGDS